MRKIISLVTVFCFLISNIGFALSPPVLFGPLGDKTDEQKLLVLAASCLMAELLEIDAARDIDDETDIDKVREAVVKRGLFKEGRTYTAEGTHPYAPTIEVTAYFNELDKVESLSDHVFSVPVSIQKAKRRIENYRLLFSTKRNGRTTFPILCREKELNEALLDKIRERDTLPERGETDRLAMANYERHEIYDREFIQWAINTGRASFFPHLYLSDTGKYERMVKHVIEEANIKVTPNDMRKILDMKLWLIPVAPGDEEAARRLTENKLVIYDEAGGMHEVRGLMHTSEKAIYMCIPGWLFDSLTEGTKYKTPDSAMISKEYAQALIEYRLANELGKILGYRPNKFKESRNGLAYEPNPASGVKSKNGIPLEENVFYRELKPEEAYSVNEIYERYYEAQSGGKKPEQIKAKAANLDFVEKRDYAGGASNEAASGARAYSEKYRELTDVLVGSWIRDSVISDREGRIISIVADAYIQEVNGELEEERANPVEKQPKIREIKRRFAEACKGIHYVERERVSEFLDILRLYAEDENVGVITGLRKMLAYAIPRRQRHEREALREAVERVRFALAQGFTSFATDTSTLTLVEEEKVKDRLEEVIKTAVSILKEIYNGAMELGIEVGNEVEVGDIGKEISTVREALALYEGLVSGLRIIIKKSGLELKKPGLFDIIALNIGTAHGYDFNEDDTLKAYTPGRINVERAREVHEAFKEMGLDVGVALHGFSGTPIEFAKGFIDKGIAKVNINTDWQAIIWKTLLAYRPDLYRKVFGLARQMAAKDKKNGYLVTDDEDYDFEHARNRIVFGFARKVFRDKDYHPLLEEITRALKEENKALPVAREQENADRAGIKLTMRQGEQWMTAFEALEMLTGDRINALIDAMELKDSASGINVDRKRELRLQKWQTDALIGRVAAAHLGLKKQAQLEDIISRLQYSNPKDRALAALEFVDNCPDENVIKEFEAYYEALPISGKTILKEALRLGRPVIAANIDNGELSALQIRAMMTRAIEENSYILFEVGPEALLTYAANKPHLPEYCARAAYEICKKTGKTVVYAVHLDHNQIKAKDYYKGEDIERLPLVAAELADDASKNKAGESLKERYLTLMKDTLNDFARVKFHPHAGQLADIVFKAYIRSIQVRVEEEKEAFKGELLKALEDLPKKDKALTAKEASEALKRVDDLLRIGTSPIVQTLHEMLVMAEEGKNPAELLLLHPMKSYFLAVAPAEEHQMAVEEIKNQFTAEELEHLISVFGSTRYRGYEGKIRIDETPYVYSLLSRLKTVLDKLSMKNRLPYKFPGEKRLGGASDLKRARFAHALRNLEELIENARQAIGDVRDAQRRTQPGRSPHDAWQVILLKQAIAALPEDYVYNGMSQENLLEGFQKAGIKLERGLEEKHALIFSKKLTFDFGLGVLLAKIAEAGMNVAVIAPEEGQQALIRELNDKHKLTVKNSEIICIPGPEHIQEAMKSRRITHSYYLRDESENDPGKFSGITNVVTTAGKIIRALREATHATSEDLKENFERAITLFKQAA